MNLSCVPLEPFAFSMYMCGKEKGHPEPCGGGTDYPSWKSVYVQHKTLLGWEQSSIFGHTLCLEEHSPCRSSVKNLIEFVTVRNQRTYPKGRWYRIVDRFENALWEGESDKAALK